MGPGCKFMVFPLLVRMLLPWPYGVSILCKFNVFWDTLHWPAGNVDLGY